MALKMLSDRKTVAKCANTKVSKVHGEARGFLPFLQHQMGAIDSRTKTLAAMNSLSALKLARFMLSLISSNAFVNVKSDDIVTRYYILEALTKLKSLKKKRTLKKKPVTQKPVTEEPVTKKSVTKKPVTKKAVTKKAVTEKPVTKKPVTKK